MGTLEANVALARRHQLTGRHVFLDRDDNQLPNLTDQLHDTTHASLFNPLTGELKKYVDSDAKRSAQRSKSFFSSSTNTKRKYTGPLSGGPVWKNIPPDPVASSF